MDTKRTRHTQMVVDNNKEKSLTLVVSVDQGLSCFLPTFTTIYGIMVPSLKKKLVMARQCSCGIATIRYDILCYSFRHRGSFLLNEFIFIFLILISTTSC